MAKKSVTVELVIQPGKDLRPVIELMITKSGITNYEALGMLTHAVDIMKENISNRQKEINETTRTA